MVFETKQQPQNKKKAQLTCAVAYPTVIKICTGFGCALSAS
jgi:hypothetical protein